MFNFYKYCVIENKQKIINLNNNNRYFIKYLNNNIRYFIKYLGNNRYFIKYLGNNRYFIKYLGNNTCLGVSTFTPLAGKKGLASPCYKQSTQHSKQQTQ